MRTSELPVFFAKTAMAAAVTFGIWWVLIRPLREGLFMDSQSSEIVAKQNQPLPKEAFQIRSCFLSPLEWQMLAKELGEEQPSMPMLMPVKPINLAVASEEQKWLLLSQRIADLIYRCCWGEKNHRQAAVVAQQCKQLLQSLNVPIAEYPTINQLSNQEDVDYDKIREEGLVQKEFEKLILLKSKGGTLEAQAPAILMTLGSWGHFNNIHLHYAKKEGAQQMMRERVLEQGEVLNRVILFFMPYLSSSYPQVAHDLKNVIEIFDTILIEEGDVLPEIIEMKTGEIFINDICTTRIIASDENYQKLCNKIADLSLSIYFASISAIE